MIGIGETFSILSFIVAFVELAHILKESANATRGRKYQILTVYLTITLVNQEE